MVRPRFALFDAGLHRISDVAQPGYRFDPRSRPWYVQAMKSRDVVVTAPYVFFTTHAAGLTLARRAANGRAVVGADVSLLDISEKLRAVRATPSSQLAVFDENGNRAIAFSDPSRLVAQVAGDSRAPRIGDVSPVLIRLRRSGGFVEIAHLRRRTGVARKGDPGQRRRRTSVDRDRDAARRAAAGGERRPPAHDHAGCAGDPRVRAAHLVDREPHLSEPANARRSGGGDPPVRFQRSAGAAHPDHRGLRPGPRDGGHAGDDPQVPRHHHGARFRAQLRAPAAAGPEGGARRRRRQGRGHLPPRRRGSRPETRGAGLGRRSRGRFAGGPAGEGTRRIRSQAPRGRLRPH